MRTLCASALFSGYSPLDIAELLTDFDVRRKVFDNGTVVAHEGESSQRMGIVLSGFLHVYDSAFKGHRHLVRIVRSGQVIGATLVAPQSDSNPALVRASGDCVVALLSLKAVGRRLRKGDSRFFDNFSAVVRDELQASWRKIAMLSCPNIAERVLLYLQDRSRSERSKTFAVGSTEAEFADFLGVHRTALARVLRKLAAEGRFSYRRDVFTLP